MMGELNSRNGLDREVLFDNERFIIGVLQVVSGGSLIAGMSQSAAISALVGKFSLLVFLTAMAAGLALAIYAAYAKHEYKKWDVKGRPDDANAWLRRMRGAIKWATVAVIGALAWLLLAAWVRAFV